MRAPKALISACLAAMMTLPAQGATLLVNGDFEVDGGNTGIYGGPFSGLATPGGRSWDIFTSLPGWTTVSGAGIEVQSNRTLGSVDAQSGQHYVELDATGNSMMAQSVYLSAGRYEFSFWYSPRMSDPATNGAVYSVLGTGTVLSGAVTGPGPGMSRGDWTQIVDRFTVVTAGTYSVRLGGSGTSNGVGGLADNVSLRAIPLPASGALLPFAMVGVALWRRRRPDT